MSARFRIFYLKTHIITGDRVRNIGLETTESEDTYKMWMTDDDLDQLRRPAASYRDD